MPKAQEWKKQSLSKRDIGSPFRFPDGISSLTFVLENLRSSGLQRNNLITFKDNAHNYTVLN
jgi:hypothetical protein